MSSSTSLGTETIVNLYMVINLKKSVHNKSVRTNKQIQILHKLGMKLLKPESDDLFERGWVLR